MRFFSKLKKKVTCKRCHKVVWQFKLKRHDKYCRHNPRSRFFQKYKQRCPICKTWIDKSRIRKHLYQCKKEAINDFRLCFCGKRIPSYRKFCSHACINKYVRVPRNLKRWKLRKQKQQQLVRKFSLDSRMQLWPKKKQYEQIHKGFILRWKHLKEEYGRIARYPIGQGLYRDFFFEDLNLRILFTKSSKIQYLQQGQQKTFKKIQQNGYDYLLIDTDKVKMPQIMSRIDRAYLSRKNKYDTAQDVQTSQPKQFQWAI